MLIQLGIAMTTKCGSFQLLQLNPDNCRAEPRKSRLAATKYSPSKLIKENEPIEYSRDGLITMKSMVCQKDLPFTVVSE